MSLFGGRQGKQSTNQSSLGWGPSGASSSARNRDERESLIPAGGDDFDDSDAISLLSNIADRDSRRGGSAARRRARARARAQGRTCGTFWLALEEFIPSMSCGLLGRRKDNDEEQRRQRAASIGSVMSRGRRSHAGEEGVGASRHSRSLSDASTDSAGSLAGSGFAESVDADAGMLDDRDIARFGQPSTSSTAADEADPSAATSTSKATAEEEAEAKAQAGAAEADAQAERQKALEAEATRLQQEAEAEAQRQRKEEARLAAEEEAAIAKARRKAERKAAKAGLLKLQQETQAAQRWRTEAEAEAAAGGFGLADADEDESYDQDAQQHFNYQDAEYGIDEEMREGDYELYGDAEEGQDGYYATVQEQGPGGVVHHHHYYHAAPPVDEEEVFEYRPSLPPVQFDGPVESTTEQPGDKAISEDEADIAGLSFGRKKSRSHHNDTNSAGSRSGSGLHPRTIPHTATSSSSSNSATRPGYRDRPRRGHGRTSSKSSNSSSGIFSYQSSIALHPAAPSTVATSIMSPLARETEPIYTQKAGSERGGKGEAVEGAMFGKADVDADEFGVITAGSDRGGAGRVKKSWRDKRATSRVADEEGEAFEGFPGF